MSYVARRTLKRTAQLRDRANDKRNVKARQLRSLSQAASQVGADMIMTPASQVATLIPGTYRSSNLWAMTVKGSGEAKFCDEIDDGIYTNDSWKIQSFVNIAQGSGANQRVGRSATVVNFHITGFLMGQQNYPVYHRVVVLIDKQANGALPAASEVFITTATLGSGGLSVGGMNAYRNLDNIHRFEVLYDKKFVVKPPIASMTDPPATSFKISRKKRIEVEWSGTDGANSTIRSNNLIMMVYTYGITGPPATAPAQLRHIMRVRYLDQ